MTPFESKINDYYKVYPNDDELRRWDSEQSLNILQTGKVRFFKVWQIVRQYKYNATSKPEPYRLDHEIYGITNPELMKIAIKFRNSPACRTLEYAYHHFEDKRRREVSELKAKIEYMELEDPYLFNG